MNNLLCLPTLAQALLQATCRRSINQYWQTDRQTDGRTDWLQCISALIYLSDRSVSSRAVPPTWWTVTWWTHDPRFSRPAASLIPSIHSRQWSLASVYSLLGLSPDTRTSYCHVFFLIFHIVLVLFRLSVTIEGSDRPKVRYVLFPIRLYFFQRCTRL